MTADDNLRLIREIESNRAFLLAAYQQNPKLLAHVELRIRELLQPLPGDVKTSPLPMSPANCQIEWWRRAG